MVRPPHGGGNKYNKWTPEEDHILVSYVQEHSPVNWASVPDNTGLKRCPTSCRFRWNNYLRPGIRRGNFTDEEDRKIIYLQSYLGNRWSSIAAFFPDRTHNDIKNYWNTCLKKKVGSAPGSSESLSLSLPGVNSAPPNPCRVMASYSVMTYRFSSFTYNVNWNRNSAPGVAAPAPVSAIAVPVRPSAVAPPYAAAPTPAFAVPARPSAAVPPYAAAPTPAFAVQGPVHPAFSALSAPTSVNTVPVHPSAAAPSAPSAAAPPPFV